MKIGIHGSVLLAQPSLAMLREQAVTAAGEGFASYWLAQPVWTPLTAGIDALTAFAAVAHQVPDIELGTNVLPIWFRHPFALAAQALTTQAATDNRFSLGLGLAHQPMIEARFDMAWRPMDRMRDYLDILLPLLSDGKVHHHGAALSAEGAMDRLPGVEPPPVYLAALGPKMLELAGTRTAGTILFLVGERTIGNHVVPAITKAAKAAGRAAPRIVCSLPICVTSDRDGTRARATAAFADHERLPSYRAVVDREGVAHAGEVALIGDEVAVGSRLRAIANSGATDFVAMEFAANNEDRRRTRDFLRSLL